MRTPLRQLFIEDLQIRNRSPRTIEAYVSHVAKYAQFHDRSPDQLGPEHVRAYQLHLREREVSWSLFNQAVSALRCFYSVTVKVPWDIQQIPFARRILDINDAGVTFRYRDNERGQQEMTLDGMELLRRFLLHVLPTGFVRIRYYGLFANCHRAENLERCRALIAAEPGAAPASAAAPAPKPSDEEDQERYLCPSCGLGLLRHVSLLSPVALPEMDAWAPVPRDTS